MRRRGRGEVKVFEDKVEKQKLGCMWVRGRLRGIGEYGRAIAQGGTEKVARPHEKSLKGAYGDSMAVEERERAKSRGAFYDLLPKVSGCHFCFTLFTRSESPSPAPTQKEGK